MVIIIIITNNINVIILARHFRLWRWLARCDGLGWSARYDLIQLAFLGWVSWWAGSASAEA